MKDPTKQPRRTSVYRYGEHCLHLKAQRFQLRLPSDKASESRPWLRRLLDFKNAFLELVCLERSCLYHRVQNHIPGSLGFRTVGVSVSVNVTSHTATEKG
jgi:hypothetical protein